MKPAHKLFLVTLLLAIGIIVMFSGTVYILTTSTLLHVISPFTAALIALPVALLSIFTILLVFQLLVINPLSTVTKAAREIADGNLEKRVVVDRSDEVGAFASSFNEMADKLQQLSVGLEQKVVAKTAELGQKVKDTASERSKYEAIIQGVSDGLIVTDNSGTIFLMNTIASQILLLPPKVYSGIRIFELFSLLDTNEKSVNPQQWPYIKATLTGTKSTEDFLYVLPNGRKIELNITASPFLGGGKIMGAITIIRDVTKERQVDRMKTEFISLASHQLRTPLSAIRWFTEMLLNGDAGKLNPEQEEFAKNVSDSTQRMIDLVNSLLNISRIESGRISIDPKPTNLKELLDTVIVEVKLKADQRKQHIIVSVHEGLPIISLDPKLIRQVFLNLLTNAIKYTPEGGEISVFISKKDKEIISQVSDNGYGIPKEQQGRIFERFFRAANIIKKETDGTGLGLYLIKAIIESSHGKIWFQSEENKGTSFFFSLPLSGMEAKLGEVTLD